MICLDAPRDIDQLGRETALELDHRDDFASL